MFKFHHVIIYIICYPVLMYTGFTRLLRTDKVLMWGRTHYFVEIFCQTIPLLLIKLYSQHQSNSGLKIIDVLFIVFAILNIVEAIIQIFFDKQIIRRGKRSSLCNKILKSNKSIFRVTYLTALSGFFLAAAVSCAFVFGFGVRVCPTGTYQNGSTCVSCTSLYGDLCSTCSGPN